MNGKTGTGARSRAALIGALAALLALAAAASAHAATIQNPGPFNASMGAGTISVPGNSEFPPTPFPNPGQFVTYQGTVDAAGNVRIPQTGISFPPFNLPSNLGTVLLVPAGPATGTIDPATGLMNLTLSLQGQITVNFGGTNTCQSQPFTVQMTTGTSQSSTGPVQGAAYNQADGTFATVDGSFNIGPVTPSPGSSPAVCQLVSSLSSQLNFMLLLQGSLNPIITTSEPLAPPVCQNQTATADNDSPTQLSLICTGVISSRAITSQPANGTLSNFNPQLGTVTYTPTLGFGGQDSFTFSASNSGGTSTATATINVTALPLACTGTVPRLVPPNVPSTVQMSCNEPVANYSISQQPRNGTLGAIDQQNGTVAYTPRRGFSGRDSFQFTASTAGNGSTDTQTVNIVVAPPPMARLVGNRAYVTPAGVARIPITTALSASTLGGRGAVTLRATFSTPRPRRVTPPRSPRRSALTRTSAGTRRTVVIGRATFNLRSRDSEYAIVRLSRQARELFAQRGRLVSRVTVTTTQPGTTFRQSAPVRSIALVPVPPPGTQYYLSLGDSLSVGAQPERNSNTSVNTDQGYANYLFALQRQVYPRGLQLRQLGCIGETTTSFLTGRGNITGRNCRPPGGSQMAAAEQFLRANRGRIAFVTIDLGANDFAGCLPPGGQVSPDLVPCLLNSLTTVQRNLPVILQRIRRAAGTRTVKVGMTLYNPFFYPIWNSTALRSYLPLAVGLTQRFNATVTGIYRAQGFRVAEVDRAFTVTDLADTAPLDGQQAPLAVANVCRYTWMCTPPPRGPNIHANPLGYRIIAERFYAQLVGRAP